MSQIQQPEDYSESPADGSDRDAVEEDDLGSEIGIDFDGDGIIDENEARQSTIILAAEGGKR